MREGFLGADTPQGDKLRGRRDQLSHRSPPGFVLNLPHFPSLSIFCRVSREKEGEDRSCRPGVPRLSVSVTVLALACSFSILFLSSSWL